MIVRRWRWYDDDYRLILEVTTNFAIRLELWNVIRVGRYLIYVVNFNILCCLCCISLKCCINLVMSQIAAECISGCVGNEAHSNLTLHMPDADLWFVCHCMMVMMILIKHDHVRTTNKQNINDCVVLRTWLLQHWWYTLNEFICSNIQFQFAFKNVWVKYDHWYWFNVRWANIHHLRLAMVWRSNINIWSEQNSVINKTS